MHFNATPPVVQQDQDTNSAIDLYNYKKDKDFTLLALTKPTTPSLSMTTRSSKSWAGSASLKTKETLQHTLKHNTKSNGSL